MFPVSEAAASPRVVLALQVGRQDARKGPSRMGAMELQQRKRPWQGILVQCPRRRKRSQGQEQSERERQSQRLGRRRRQNRKRVGQVAGQARGDEVAPKQWKPGLAIAAPWDGGIGASRDTSNRFHDVQVADILSFCHTLTSAGLALARAIAMLRKFQGSKRTLYLQRWHLQHRRVAQGQALAPGLTNLQGGLCQFETRAACEFAGKNP